MPFDWSVGFVFQGAKENRLTDVGAWASWRCRALCAAKVLVLFLQESSHDRTCQIKSRRSRWTMMVWYPAQLKTPFLI